MELEDPIVYNSNVAYLRTEDIQQRHANAILNHNKVKTSIKASNSNRILSRKNIWIIMIVILTIILTVLSVVTISQLNSKQSTLSSQLNEANNDIVAVLTQLATIHNNVSQKFFQFDAKINNLISFLLQNTDMEPQSNCGPGLWYQMIHLNMSDPSQQCPSVWREYNTDGIRACGRSTTTTGSCAIKTYFASHQYSRMCGRVIGYQVASPDAFARPYTEKIDFDGVNITRGAKRNHVWSYVAGFSESATNFNCPCSTTNSPSPPSSIGKNYYCESGNPGSGNTFKNNQIFPNDPLWDGQQCEGTCCNGTNSPPWFSVQLPAPTTDAIEVSICADESTDNEDTPIELLEIYIQ